MRCTTMGTFADWKEKSASCATCTNYRLAVHSTKNWFVENNNIQWVEFSAIGHWKCFPKTSYPLYWSTLQNYIYLCVFALRIIISGYEIIENAIIIKVES